LPYLFRQLGSQCRSNSRKSYRWPCTCVFGVGPAIFLASVFAGTTTDRGGVGFVRLPGFDVPTKTLAARDANFPCGYFSYAGLGSLRGFFLETRPQLIFILYLASGMTQGAIMNAGGFRGSDQAQPAPGYECVSTAVHGLRLEYIPVI